MISINLPLTSRQVFYVYNIQVLVFAKIYPGSYSRIE